MQLNLDVANLRQLEYVALDPERLPCEHKTMETIATFKSWKTWILTSLDTSEEILERTIKTNQYRLQGMSMDAIKLGSVFFDSR
jgi:hypothetical protein